MQVSLIPCFWVQKQPCMAPVFTARRILYYTGIHVLRNKVSGALPTGFPRTMFVLALKSLGSNLMLRYLTT